MIAYVAALRRDLGADNLATGVVQGRRSSVGGAPVGRPFVIGSVTKTFTALAVMQLVEAGRVNLDDPVHSYLPQFRTSNPGRSDAITVRQLPNQTSGLSTAAGEDPFRRPPT